MTAMSVLRRVQDTWDVLLANDASHAKAEWVKEISPRVSGPIVTRTFIFSRFLFFWEGGTAIYFYMHNTAELPSCQVMTWLVSSQDARLISTDTRVAYYGMG